MTETATPPLTDDASLYERDHALWLAGQAQALRSRRLDLLDLTNLAEEIEDLGKSHRREVESRLETLVVHLLKIAVSTAREPQPGWRRTVREQRRQLLRLFRDSPSLKPYARDLFQAVLLEARYEAWAALTDHEPQHGAQYDEAIRATIVALNFEDTLKQGVFWGDGRGADRP